MEVAVRVHDFLLSERKVSGGVRMYALFFVDVRERRVRAAQLLPGTE